MTRLSWKGAIQLAALWVVVAVIGGWVQRAVAQQKGADYPAPRFPVLPKDPTSVEEAMPYARKMAENTAGSFGLGLGASKAGETIVVIPSGQDNPHILEALRRALSERKVTAVFLRLTPTSATEWAYMSALKLPPPQSRNSSRIEGFMEVRGWFNSFAHPHAPQAWLKKTRLDLYDQLYEKTDPEYTPTPKTIQYGMNPEARVLQEYLRSHPQVDGVYWGGSWIYLAPALGPFASKWRGSAIFDRWTVMSDVSSYPGDVWVLSETKNIEPIGFVDRARLTDPEGTDLSLEVSPELAQRWAKGVYERAHNMLGPNMATGRYARNTVSYPALQNEWIPRSPMAQWNGVVAGTTNHVGFFPKMEVHYQNGYVTKVVGGGTYGELMRTFLNYPNINTVTYPFQDRRGYFNLQEVALGTNPKVFRGVRPANEPLDVITERVRAGYIHIGVGTQLESDPTSKGPSPTWQAFVEKYDVPYYHNFHVHIYFGTYEVRLRNAEKWIKITDRGRMKSLDDTEVRALASRYGDPDKILEDAWFPEIPGINAAGKLEEYARDPLKYHRLQNDKIAAGNYGRMTQ